MQVEAIEVRLAGGCLGDPGSRGIATEAQTAATGAANQDYHQEARYDLGDSENSPREIQITLNPHAFEGISLACAR